MLTICPACNAELVSSGEECFICGHVFGTIVVEKSTPEPIPSFGTVLSWEKEDLPSGITINSRYAIRQREGISERWVWYRVVDLEEGIDCFIQILRSSSDVGLKIIEAENQRESLEVLFPVLMAATEPWIYLVFQQQGGESLPQIMSKSPPENVMLQWAYQILVGVDKAHQLGLANFSLTPESIWISSSGIAQLRLSEANELFSEEKGIKDLRRIGILLFWAFSKGKMFIGQDLTPLYPRQAQLIRHILFDTFSSASQVYPLMKQYENRYLRNFPNSCQHVRCS